MGFEAGSKWRWIFYSSSLIVMFFPQDLRPPLLPGQLDSTAGPCSGNGAAGPQHLGLVCRCRQCALLGLVSQTLPSFSRLVPGFSEVNSIWKVVSASISLLGTV